MRTGPHRPSARLLGVHRLTALLVLIQAGMLVFDIIGFRVNGLTFKWTTAAADIALPLLLIAAWAYYFAWPGREPGDWVTAELFLILALFMSISAIAPLGQYAAVAFKRPLIDSWLAAGDAMVGVHVPTLTAWTSAHSWLSKALLYAYLSLRASSSCRSSCWVPGIGIEWRCGIRISLSRLFGHHVACVALWPVAVSSTYYGFEPARTLNDLSSSSRACTRGR